MKCGNGEVPLRPFELKYVIKSLTVVSLYFGGLFCDSNSLIGPYNLVSGTRAVVKKLATDTLGLKEFVTTLWSTLVNLSFDIS